MTISPALFPAVTVTVVRDRKIPTALRTNQIAGFVTEPSWKKKIKLLTDMILILIEKRSVMGSQSTEFVIYLYHFSR